MRICSRSREGALALSLVLCRYWNTVSMRLVWHGSDLSCGPGWSENTLAQHTVASSSRPREPWRHSQRLSRMAQVRRPFLPPPPAPPLSLMPTAHTPSTAEEQGAVSRSNLPWPHLQEVPVYSVGPATTRALRAVPQDPPLQVFGEHTGNGDSLAHFILAHYAQWYEDRTEEKPGLLFMVGEQRRDIIPKTLMDEELPRERRVRVDEVVVYGTGVMESFADDFQRRLQETKESRTVWVVVFSPTGCDAMLRGLGMIDEATGRAKPKDPNRTRFVATIGPTTRSYLQKTFGLDPDVCAEKPSPEGVLEGIQQFMSQMS
jgi:uroporphyrinogen-III synthase